MQAQLQQNEHQVQAVLMNTNSFSTERYLTHNRADTDCKQQNMGSTRKNQQERKSTQKFG